MILILGEVTCSAAIDYQRVARDTIKHIGYDDSNKGVESNSEPLFTSPLSYNGDIVEVFTICS